MIPRGIATIESGGISRVCAVGKVHALETALRSEPLRGQVGIAHTRWATHGAPTESNAHPHVAPGVAVVHNGIIENYRELRQELSDGGVVFRGETDSEVIPWMLSKHMDEGLKPLEALRKCGEEMRGAFAVAALTQSEPNSLLALRRGSPLAVGFGEKGAALASDPNALAGFACEAMMLDDGDSAELGSTGIDIRNAKGEKVHRQIIRIDDSAFNTNTGDYAHHMLKEIHEQPQVMQRILSALWARQARSSGG